MTTEADKITAELMALHRVAVEAAVALDVADSFGSGSTKEQLDALRADAAAAPLRRAIHALAAESHALQEVVAELYGQIKKFAAEQGEADFYTGRALAILCKTRPMEYAWPFTNKPDEVLADIWPAPTQSAPQTHPPESTQPKEAMP